MVRDMVAEAKRIRTVESLVWEEFDAAVEKFGPFNSPHEGYAIIKEELDELWEAVREHNSENMEEEAIQVAAMAIRFLVDCTPYEWDGNGIVDDR